MKQIYFLKDYLDYEQHKTFKDRILYISLAFRPASTLLLCILLTILILTPCAILMIKSEKTSITYNMSFGLFTGIAASGFVSFIIELANNYRHNYQRLLILHEYLFTVSSYEENIKWCLRRRADNNHPVNFTARNMSVSELILEICPIIEAAYNNSKEYMSPEEIKFVITVIEAASKIGELPESFASKNMSDASNSSMYQVFQEPLQSDITSFATEFNISIVEEKIVNVITDYILVNPDILGKHEQHELVNYLNQFDAGMQKLQNFIKNEPCYRVEIIP